MSQYHGLLLRHKTQAQLVSNAMMFAQAYCPVPDSQNKYWKEAERLQDEALQMSLQLKEMETTKRKRSAEANEYLKKAAPIAAKKTKGSSMVDPDIIRGYNKVLVATPLRDGAIEDSEDDDDFLQLHENRLNE